MSTGSLVPTDGTGKNIAHAVPTTTKIKAGGRQTKFLSQSVILEEGGNKALVRSALYFVSAVIVLFIIWAIMVEVDEVSTGFGQVIPAGQVQTIQHLEGGIVKEILIEEGTLVKEGQVLITLSAASASAELEQMKARKASLELQAERYRAFGTGREPDFSFVSSNYKDLITDQISIHEIQKEARNSQNTVLFDQIEQRKAELSQLEEQRKTLNEQLAILEEERDMRENLFKKGLSSKILFFNVQRDVNQVKGDLAKLIGEKRRITNSLAEIRSRLIEADAKSREEALSSMGGVIGELAQVRESIAKLQDRSTRLEIRSPVDGIIKGLKIHTVGGVVAAGAILLEVVPMKEELVVESRINPRDVGHVHVGQKVQVKVTTFDFARYGGITGELKSISATTFADEKGDPYYKGLVMLDRNYVGFDPEKNKVLPGMTVQADVNTGKKTLIQYLLKPIYTSLSGSFHER
ncbi:MAG: HlyD family type I secretion periplasmic adaptor subunit [Rhodospirillales bacterium]|nr:HlyD family type I secretion periplasmic adaptor subunit [Rhodospirillales bacterium]